MPVDIKPRVLSTAIDLDDATASMELALRVATYFEISAKDAYQIAYEVGLAVTKWRSAAANLGIPTSEIDRMASAFEHTELKKAVSAKPVASTSTPRKNKHKESL